MNRSVLTLDMVRWLTVWWWLVKGFLRQSRRQYIQCVDRQVSTLDRQGENSSQMQKAHCLPVFLLNFSFGGNGNSFPCWEVRSPSPQFPHDGRMHSWRAASPQTPMLMEAQGTLSPGVPLTESLEATTSSSVLMSPPFPQFFSFQECLINGIVQFVTVWHLLLSFSIILWRVVQMVVRLHQ